MHLIYFATFTLILNLIAASNYLFTFIKADFLPEYFRLIIIRFGIGMFWIFIVKIDILLAEIKLNLSPFKVFYYLMNDSYFKHKLNDSNFNRLAILARIILIMILDYFTLIIGIISMGLYNETETLEIMKLHMIKDIK